MSRIKIYKPTEWKWVSINSSGSGPGSDPSSGNDVLNDFLHRITTVNVKSLTIENEIGSGHKGCILNASGKIRAYFTLWHYGEGDYAFELDAGTTGHWDHKLFSAIDELTFGENLTITDVTKLECRWLFSAANSIIPGQALAPYKTMATDEEIRICNHGEWPSLGEWYTVWGRPARLAQWIDKTYGDNLEQIDFETLERSRIQALLPKADNEITDSTIPLEVGLLDAIAQDKGCYPGQEVIERILSHGTPPKRLCLMTGEGAPPVHGGRILNMAEIPAEIGTVTSVIIDDKSEKGFFALGILNKIHSKENLPIKFENGTTATIKCLSKIS